MYLGVCILSVSLPFSRMSTTTAGAATQPHEEHASDRQPPVPQAREPSGVATAALLLLICVISVSIRLFSVVQWGSVRDSQVMTTITS